MDGQNNENPIKIHDLGVPLFLETPICWHRLSRNQNLDSKSGFWKLTGYSPAIIFFKIYLAFIPAPTFQESLLTFQDSEFLLFQLSVSFQPFHVATLPPPGHQAAGLEISFHLEFHVLIFSLPNRPSLKQAEKM